ERHHRAMAGAHPAGAVGRRHGDDGHSLERELGEPGERVVPLTVEVLTRGVGHQDQATDYPRLEGELSLRSRGIAGMTSAMNASSVRCASAGVMSPNGTLITM